MREYIIADNQDISKAGMMFLLNQQKDVSALWEADNKSELIQQLRLHPQAIVILDYTLFDFAGADELLILQERFKEADWILFSDELSVSFLRQMLLGSTAFSVIMKDNSKEEITSAFSAPHAGSGTSATTSATCCFRVQALPPILLLQKAACLP